MEIKIGDILELEVYPEVCCEMCNDVIHNHIDCPVCKKEYAGTDQYCDLFYEKEVQCENCGAKFEKTSDSWYYNCKVIVTKI